MFPKKNIRFCAAGGTLSRIRTHVDEKTGVVVEEFGDCNTKLPDAEMFDIANQIKAGITLNEVSTQIINDASYADINAGAEDVIAKAIKKSKTETKED